MSEAMVKILNGNTFVVCRQQIVEFAALEATVARLPEQARSLLGKLSVFHRSFPLQALEQGLT